jgi:cell division protein FtsQ
VLWVLAAFVVAAVASGVVVSPVLDVNQIEVVGVDGAHADEVRAATGVEPGEALLLVDTGAATERIDVLAWVDEARVSRQLPGTLRVTVTPRFPVSWRATETGTVELIDGRGVPVTTAPAIPAGLPELQAGSAPDVRAAAHVASQLGSTLAPQVARVIVDGGWGRLWLHSGVEVRLGAVHRELQSKLRAAAAIHDALGGANVNYIRVEVPSAPTTG